jgi:predicted nucleic acid-binding protein
MRPRFLADTSAVARIRHRPPVAAVLRPLTTEREVAICTPVLLELLYGTRATEYRKAKMVYETSMSVLPITPEASSRAVEVQTMLARTGQHRTAKIVDLLTAACAEVNGLTMLHYDRDFDAIAKVTGQPAQWVVPSGSVS